jgi:putative sterol carrier protein
MTGAGKGRGGGGAGDAAAQFFEGLAMRAKEPLLHNTSGSIRIDLLDEGRVDHFHVMVDEGSVNLSRRNTRADTIVRSDRALFNKMAEGKMNPFAAFLRGLFVIEGDPSLMSSLARLFPGPPTSNRRTSPGKGR